MHNVYALVLASLLPLGAAAAVGGSEGTGGGKGVVCRGKNGKIKSVELLDLWEAKTLYKRKISSSKAPVEKQFSAALTRLKYAMSLMGSLDGDNVPADEHFMREVERRAAPFFNCESELVKRRSGIALTPTNDSFEDMRPQDCAVEQIVNYKMGGGSIEILVNQDLFKKMSRTDQAALIMHEALYRRLRDFQEPNSIRARRAVGYVFAGLSFPSPEENLPEDRLTCFHPKMSAATPYFHLYMAKDGSGLQAIRVFDGKYNLGYFPSEAATWPAMDPSSWKQVFTDQACVANPDFARDILIGGSGPSEYDTQSQVMLRCQDGRLKIVFDNLRGKTVGGENAQELLCTDGH
jgi:hypothetical protein